MTWPNCPPDVSQKPQPHVTPAVEIPELPDIEVEKDHALTLAAPDPLHADPDARQIAPEPDTFAASAAATPLPSPVNPAIGKPVAFVSTAALGVPRFGVVNTGLTVSAKLPLPLTPTQVNVETFELGAPKSITLVADGSELLGIKRSEVVNVAGAPQPKLFDGTAAGVPAIMSSLPAQPEHADPVVTVPKNVAFPDESRPPRPPANEPALFTWKSSVEPPGVPLLDTSTQLFVATAVQWTR